MGAVTEAIICKSLSYKSIEEWRNYYFQNISSENYTEELGKNFFIKVTEVLQAE